MSTLVDSTETNGRTLGPRSSRRCAPAVAGAMASSVIARAGSRWLPDRILDMQTLAHVGGVGSGRTRMRGGDTTCLLPPQRASVCWVHAGDVWRRVGSGMPRPTSTTSIPTNPDSSQVVAYDTEAPVGVVCAGRPESVGFKGPGTSAVFKARRLTRIRPPESGARMSP